MARSYSEFCMIIPDSEPGLPLDDRKQNDAEMMNQAIDPFTPESPIRQETTTLIQRRKLLTGLLATAGVGGPDLGGIR
jgi:hypothetical protein